MNRTIVFLCLCVMSVSMAQTDQKLKKYRARRSISSGEPRGGKKRTKAPIFVVQKHAARSLHFDVRLEIDGVLVSWAVPKGPSLNPKIKRLAVRTDDHPMDYAKFEGVIPKGHYGAGPVMVWDKGTYRNIKKKDGKLVPMSQCLKDGHIEVFLKGKRLKGSFAFIKTGMGWLLIKMRDEYANARKNITSSEKTSVKSGKTMAEIAKSRASKKWGQ